MFKSIGGYFELEISDRGSLFHDKAIAVNSGRNALELILKQIQPTHLHIPYYTCDVVIKPIEKAGIAYSFYYVNKELYPVNLNVNKNEFVLVNNYFGLTGHHILRLKQEGYNLIVDNSLAFFEQPIDNTPTFYSSRKFFGVPDGAFVYYSGLNDITLLDRDISEGRSSHLLKRIDLGSNAGYQDFKRNEDAIGEIPLKQMSLLSEKILRGIDYESVRGIRTNNFRYLHGTLSSMNELSELIDSSTVSGPMIYPFLKEGNELLWGELVKKGVFTGKYWPNVIDWVNPDSFENHISRNLIALPIDQRYSQEEMNFIIDCLT